MRFPGQIFDPETGLCNNGFRDYSPALGRYVESDPFGLAGGINTYAYARNNPVSFADPFGLDSESSINQIASAISGLTFVFASDLGNDAHNELLHYALAQAKSGSATAGPLPISQDSVLALLAYSLEGPIWATQI